MTNPFWKYYDGFVPKTVQDVGIPLQAVFYNRTDRYEERAVNSCSFFLCNFVRCYTNYSDSYKHTVVRYFVQLLRNSKCSRRELIQRTAKKFEISDDLLKGW